MSIIKIWRSGFSWSAVQPICKVLNQSVSKRLRWVALAWRGWPSIVGQTHFLVLGFHTSCPTDPCVSRATFACLTRAKLPTMPGPQHWLLTWGTAQIFFSFKPFFGLFSLLYFCLPCLSVFIVFSCPQTAL